MKISDRHMLLLFDFMVSDAGEIFVWKRTRRTKSFGPRGRLAGEGITSGSELVLLSEMAV